MHLLYECLFPFFTFLFSLSCLLFISLHNRIRSTTFIQRNFVGTRWHYILWRRLKLFILLWFHRLLLLLWISDPFINELSGLRGSLIELGQLAFLLCDALVIIIDIGLELQIILKSPFLFHLLLSLVDLDLLFKYPFIFLLFSFAFIQLLYGICLQNIAFFISWRRMMLLERI